MIGRTRTRYAVSDASATMLQPPPPYRLSPMDGAHIDAVLAIDRQSFPTPASANLLHYEITQNELAQYQILIAEEALEPAIIGHAGYWMMADEAHISTIAVTPAWRGRGLGELLLINILFMANDQAAQMATLEVRQSNEVALALYSKYRFERVGVRRGYYRDTGENAVLMTVSPLDATYYQFLRGRQRALYARLRRDG